VTGHPHFDRIMGALFIVAILVELAAGKIL
jgi:hypothetical protein